MNTSKNVETISIATLIRQAYRAHGAPYYRGLRNPGAPRLSGDL